MINFECGNGKPRLIIYKTLSVWCLELHEPRLKLVTHPLEERNVKERFLINFEGVKRRNASNYLQDIQCGFLNYTNVA